MLGFGLVVTWGCFGPSRVIDVRNAASRAGAATGGGTIESRVALVLTSCLAKPGSGGRTLGRQLRKKYSNAHEPRVGDPALAGAQNLLVGLGDQADLRRASRHRTSTYVPSGNE